LVAKGKKEVATLGVNSTYQRGGGYTGHGGYFPWESGSYAEPDCGGGEGISLKGGEQKNQTKLAECGEKKKG